MNDENDIEEPEHGIRPVASESTDIEAVIEEAVEAVEAVERRRDDEGAAEDVPLPEDAEGLQRQMDQLRDRLLRTLADFDNFRKRTEREREDDRKYAAVELLREVVAIVDNLERALASEGGLDDLKLGVEMILRQIEDVLRRSGVEEVEALGREFDPSFHEAVSRLEDPEVDVPRVIDEMQRGYTVHDRLLRPSIVRVAVPARAERQDDDSEGGSVEGNGGEEEQ